MLCEYRGERMLACTCTRAVESLWHSGIHSVPLGHFPMGPLHSRLWYRQEQHGTGRGGGKGVRHWDTDSPCVLQETRQWRGGDKQVGTTIFMVLKIFF